MARKEMKERIYGNSDVYTIDGITVTAKNYKEAAEKAMEARNYNHKGFKYNHKGHKYTITDEQYALIDNALHIIDNLHGFCSLHYETLITYCERKYGDYWAEYKSAEEIMIIVGECYGYIMAHGDMPIDDGL